MRRETGRWVRIDCQHGRARHPGTLLQRQSPQPADAGRSPLTMRSRSPLTMLIRDVLHRAEFQIVHHCQEVAGAAG